LQTFFRVGAELSLVVASISESTELFGWFDAQAASHEVKKIKAIVFFKKISRMLEKNTNSWTVSGPTWFQKFQGNM